MRGYDLTALPLQVVIIAMFGTEPGGLGEQFGRAVDTVNSFIGRYVPGEIRKSAETSSAVLSGVTGGAVLPGRHGAVPQAPLLARS